MHKQTLNLNRILLAGILLLVGLVTSALADYQSTVVGQGPVGYWRMNELTPVANLSTIATNLGTMGASGNGAYAGNLAGRGVAGAVAGNNAAHFDASVQYEAVVLNNNYAPGNFFSAECWVSPDANSANLQCIMGIGDTASTARRGWIVYLNGGGANTFQLRCFNGVNTASVNATATTNYLANTFYHLAVTRSNAVFRIYVNGVHLGSATPATYAEPAAGSQYTIATRPGPAANLANMFPGKVDEAVYYTNLLDLNTIKAHYYAATTNAAGYSAQILADNPAVYLRLDEPPLAPTANLGSLGSANNGQMAYPATSGVTGPTNTDFPGFSAANVGVSFSGASSSKGDGGYVSVPSLSLNTNGVTITAWVKPNGSQAGGAGLVMHRSKVTAPCTGTTAGLRIDLAGGLDLGYNWDGDDSTIAWASGVGLVDAQWNFVSLIVQPDKAILFAPNGTNPNPSTNTHTHGVLEFTGTTAFGTDLAGSGFNGTMDEVAIFKRALTMGEVYSQYGAALSNVPPRIFADPTAPDGTIYAGDPLTLAVDAGGTGPLSYQWRKNSADISGATDSSYSIASLVAGGPDLYDVVVTNFFGNLTSASASITVLATNTPVVVNDIPVTTRKIYAGGAIKFNVSAVGGGNTYQWQLYGTNLPGKTASSLTINNIVDTNAGPYQLRITNAVGDASSAVATITLATPGVGSYDAAVGADKPVSWWRMDDSPGSGWMLDAMGRSDGGYSNTVTRGVSGALTNDSNKAANFVLSDQGWGEAPMPVPVTTGDFTFECWVRSTNVSATEMVPFSSFRPKYGFYFQRNPDGTWRTRDGYGELDAGNSRQSLLGSFASNQWTHLVTTYSTANGSRSYFNGRWDGNSFVDFPRNRNTPMRIGALDPLNLSGQQRWFDGEIDEVAVYNKALTDVQILNHYLVGLYSSNNAPVFAIQPANQTVFIGATATFPTLIEGSPTITNQWYKNGVPIPNQTNATLTIANTAYTDAIGVLYKCIAANAAGNATSIVATLTVLPQPTHIVLTNQMVLYMKFDGDYQDSSGKGHHGTAVGTPTVVAGQVGSGALKYSTTVTDPSGSGGSIVSANYLTIGSFAYGTDLSFSTNRSFSVAYWVKTPTNALTGDLPIISSANNSYGNPGVTIAPSYKTGAWSWSLGDSGTYSGVSGTASTVNNGQWHHVLSTFNRTNGNGLTYLDGALVNTHGLSTVGDLDSLNSFNVGQDPTGGYLEAGTNTIDDLAIWKDRIITATEAYSAFYAGKTFGRSIDAVAPITMTLVNINGTNWIVYQDGTLYQANSVNGPWTAVSGATAPYYQIPVDLAAPPVAKFYMVRQAP